MITELGKNNRKNVQAGLNNSRDNIWELVIDVLMLIRRYRDLC
jgi:hypothetical protein